LKALFDDPEFSEGRGREFESRRARHEFKGLASLIKSHLLAGKQWVSKRQKIEPPARVNTNDDPHRCLPHVRVLLAK
jgi:hypothetical protein